jgi:hypothetical protein
MRGWLRYGMPSVYLACVMLIVCQRLGCQPCTRAHPEGIREPHVDTEASAFGLSCLTTQLRHLHAIFRPSSYISYICRHTTITDRRSACGAEAGHRRRLESIRPSVSRRAGLLLQPHRIETTKRSVARGCSASLRSGWLCRQGVRSGVYRFCCGCRENQEEATGQRGLSRS